MNLRLLTAGAAIVALTAGAAAAATHHHHRHAAKSAGAYAEPAQPIAYSKLDSYLHASAAQRKGGSWAIDTQQAAAAASG